MPDLITISVPTYRRPSLLLHALHSCLMQNYRPLEIDVGDDSPSNESELLVKRLVIPEGISLRYWRNSPGVGQAANVNRLFSEARGSRLVLLHDDDLLLPGAVTALDSAWQGVPDILAVYGLQDILFDSGEVDVVQTGLKSSYYKRDRLHVGEQRKLLVSALWRQFPNNGYLIDANAARKIGYRSFEDVGHACDTDFSIRLAMHFPGRSFFLIDQITSQYRYNFTSLSRSQDVTWRLFDYVRSLKNLSAEEITAQHSLMREIAAQATKENALGGRRLAALKIFCSAFYPRRQPLAKSLYHLGLIVSSRLSVLRRISTHSASQVYICSPDGYGADDFRY